MMIAHAIRLIEPLVPAPRVVIRRMVHLLVVTACGNGVAIPTVRAVATVPAVATVDGNWSMSHVMRRAGTNADAETTGPHKDAHASPSVIGLRRVW